MRVLVTNNTLGGLGGSETYAYTLIKELHRRSDIQVSAYSPALGLIASKLSQEGVQVLQRIPNNFDLILASHNSTTKLIKRYKGIKVQTCHGVYPKLEQPDVGMDKYVAISEEVQKHLMNKRLPSQVIFNGVDCERFQPKTPLNSEIKKILSLSHDDGLNNILRSICAKRGIQLIALNKYRNPLFNVEDIMNGVDLVITLGRGAYEAMACGRNVLILDKRPYINKPPLGDGMIMGDNVNDFMKNNCSGRFSNKVFGVPDIETELDKYDPKWGEMNREFALSELNIIKQADKYLSLV
jgi:glycosyltransferase involved in cell wall biosynthesis